MMYVKEKDLPLINQISAKTVTEIVEFIQDKFKATGALTTSGPLVEIITHKKDASLFIVNMLIAVIGANISQLSKHVDISNRILYELFDEGLIAILKKYDSEGKKSKKDNVESNEANDSECNFKEMLSEALKAILEGIANEGGVKGSVASENQNKKYH